MSNSSSYAIPTGNLYDISHIMQMPPEATSTLDIIQKAVAVGTSGLGSFGLTGALTFDLIGINAESTIITKYIDSADRIDFIIFLSTSSSGKNFSIGTIDTNTSVVTVNYSNNPATSDEYVLRTGDTMTGNLEIDASSSQVILKDTNHNGDMYTGWGAGHKNHGVYSYGYAPTASTWTDDGKWLVYRDSSGNVKLNGNADTATSAAKLTTARSIALSADFQGSANFDGSANVTINGYHRYCTVDSSNKSNFPWHRIATVSMGTAQWQDADIILDIRHKFDGGAFGRIKLSARTNSTNAACSCTARWMYRYGMAVGSVIIAWWGVTGNDVYADVYYNVGTYARCVVSRYEGTATHEFTLISSNEVADTTTSDKKTSVEVYKDVATAATQLRGKAYTSTSTSVDAATVSASGSATNATNIYAKSGSYKTVANTLLEMVYPVGSIYMSTVNTSPATFLGGTWTQIKGRFLLGVGANAANTTTTYGSLSASSINRSTVKEQGGRISVQLTLPNYRKRLYIWQGSSGGAGGTAILNGDYIAYGQNYNCWLTDSDNEAFYIMPPYFTVYMWERTA